MIQPIGFFKIWRSLFSKPIWLNSTLEQQVILLTLISMANFRENDWEWKGQKYTVEAGQFITSTQSIIENTGKNVSSQNVKSALKRFEKLNFLTNESTKQGRLITIANWEDYQEKCDTPNQVINQEVTKRSPTGNQGVTTKEESNKEKKTKKVSKVSKSCIREGTIKHGEFDNVYLKESEKEKLISIYGLAAIEQQIENLSNYIENFEKGKKYKNHYATLRTWCQKLPKKVVSQEPDKKKQEADKKKLVEEYGKDWEKQFDDINF